MPTAALGSSKPLIRRTLPSPWSSCPGMVPALPLTLSWVTLPQSAAEARHGNTPPYPFRDLHRPAARGFRAGQSGSGGCFPDPDGSDDSGDRPGRISRSSPWNRRLGSRRRSLYLFQNGFLRRGNPCYLPHPSSRRGSAIILLHRSTAPLGAL